MYDFSGRFFLILNLIQLKFSRLNGSVQAHPEKSSAKRIFFQKNHHSCIFQLFPLENGGLFNIYQQVINITCSITAGPYYNFTPSLKIVKEEREKKHIFIFHFFYFQHLYF